MKVISMQETCPQCGRRSDVEDRDPVWSDSAETEALRCPECGQLDELLWISDEDSPRLVFAEAKLEERVQLSQGI
jgi:hypothetical protein